MKDLERLPRPKRTLTGSARLPWTRSSGELAAVGARLAAVAVRAKVNLTVSGLKSDSPPRVGLTGSASACVRAQERAVCRNSRANSRSRRNTRPSAGLQKDFSSDERESARKPGVSLEAADDRPAASLESVQPDADEQGDCRNKKDLQMKPFFEAAEGIRTLDLLHGKQDPRPPFCAE
jgi:hypothetical protein